MIKEDSSNIFCCKGCQSVFHILKDNKLDTFYDKIGQTTLSQPKTNFIDSSSFDSIAFYEKYVQKTKNGLCEISLVIEGIHCSACVWLNEKVLSNLDGIIEANINFTSNKANIIWNDNIIKLSKIIETIRSIGYDAFAYDNKTYEDKISSQRKSYYLRMALAIFASMNVMWIAIAQYAGYFSGMSQDVKNILNIAEFILATPVLFYSGWIFFRGAYYGLKHKNINMDLLVASGATLVYFYSIYIMLKQSGEAYFDSVVMIITFILVGKFLEILSKKQVGDVLDAITKDIPSQIRVIINGEIIYKNLQDVMVGDSVVIGAGEKLFLDGKLSKGSGNFDESSISGESRYVYKQVGDTITSGTISIDSNIEYIVSKEFKHSTLSNIAKALEGAIKKKPRIEQLANILSSYFSATILSISIVTFLYWFLVYADFDKAFMVGVSVIIIACPCALALATPVATLVGLSKSASKGILFKEASTLETLAKIDTIILDKTGTITNGKPSIKKITILKEFDKNILYSLTKLSKHPISKAISQSLDGLGEIIFDESANISSMGLSAKKDGKLYLGGNIKLLKYFGIEFDYQSQNSLFFYAIENEVVAIYELDDELKSNALEFVEFAKNAKLDIVLLSGDNQNTTSKIAKTLNIDKYYFEQTPQDKLSFIESMHSQNKRVLMVGDGINDALALAKADVSIAMGSGSDIALEVGDVVLLNNSINSLKNAILISKLTLKLIKQNISISLVYNSITIPLAMMGYIIPLVAAISMSFSSLLVVANSLRIKNG